MLFNVERSQRFLEKETMFQKQTRDPDSSLEETDSPPVVSAECEKVDPRVRRTRVMLRMAMSALLESAPFDTISVQQIAERAAVNRATFYAHYADREALLEDTIRSRFDELLEIRQVSFDGTCPSALRVVILAVYDFLREMSSGCRRQQRHFDPFLQSVVQAEVEKVLIIGLEKGAFRLGSRPVLVAATLSWAIYGAAISAIRSVEEAPNPELDAGQFVDDVYNLILPILITDSSVRDVAASHHD
jgi:AcrR family transcriptional regulator